MFRRLAIFLSSLILPATHRLLVGFQTSEVLRCFIRRGTAGLLLLAQLRQLKLERADLFRRLAILLVSLIQPATHRLLVGFQTTEVLRSFIRRGTVGLLLLAQLRHLLLKGRLLGNPARFLLIRHPLLEHADLIGHPTVFLIGLLQLFSDRCQFITQYAFSFIKSTFKLFHHGNSRLERFFSRICSRPTIGHYPKPFTENFYFSDIKVL